MRKGSNPMRTLRVASFVLALAALASTSRAAGEKAITLGEVSSQVASDHGLDYAALVRSVSEDELRAIDTRGLPHGKRVIVSVSLVRLDTLALPRSRATCVVSATLRDAKGGAVFALLEGQAQAMDGERHAIETSALHGALHGALARIPEALRH
jgi:hypothetical protein